MSKSIQSSYVGDTSIHVVLENAVYSVLIKHRGQDHVVTHFESARLRPAVRAFDELLATMRRGGPVKNTFAVGDVITSEEQTDLMPDRVVLMHHEDSNRPVAIQWFTDEFNGDGSGWGTGDGKWRVFLDDYLPATIIWLAPDTDEDGAL
jgi:hypothetical protein